MLLDEITKMRPPFCGVGTAFASPALPPGASAPGYAAVPPRLLWIPRNPTQAPQQFVYRDFYFSLPLRLMMARSARQ